MFVAHEEIIRRAVRQVERWLFAARQDRHPGVALLHANYAVGDLDLLRQLYEDADVRRVTGRDPPVLLAEASRLQDEAQANLNRLCRGLLVLGAWHG